jgi:hypothetical protein
VCRQAAANALGPVLATDFVTISTANGHSVHRAVARLAVATFVAHRRTPRQRQQAVRQMTRRRAAAMKN